MTASASQATGIHLDTSPRPRTETKTIGFVDCCGFSAYTEANGDAAGLSVHLRMRRALELEAASAGVTVVKWMGDGAMLAGDNGNAVLSCVYRTMLAMRESGSLPLRAGITSGRVTRVPCGELDYLGHAVNRAARLCAQATPWQARAARSSGCGALHFTLRPSSVSASRDDDLSSARRVSRVRPDWLSAGADAA